MLRFKFKGTNIKVHIYHNENYNDEERLKIIEEYHVTPSGGHAGYSRTIKKLKLNFSWENLNKEVKNFIKN
jgi:hypothetical protein